MNTLQPPNWALIFADDTTFTSDQGSWSDVADLVDVDGLWVYQTQKNVVQVHAFFSRSNEGMPFPLMTLRPPVPIPCFAHMRWRSSLGDGADWLYTCFGYILAPYRVTLAIASDHIEQAITPCLTPFLP